MEKRIGFTGWAGKSGMAGLLQVVDEAEEVVPGRLELVGGPVRDTEKFDGIVVQASFHGPVAGGADLDEAIGGLEPFRRAGIGQGIGGNAQQDELGRIVLIVVEAGLDPRGGASFPESRQQPIAYPIEE
jgi:hypothetical protein